MQCIAEEEKAVMKVERATKEMHIAYVSMVVVGILDLLVGVRFNVKIVEIRF